MLPALEESLKAIELHRLDLLARLCELAAARLLEQPARCPAHGVAIAAEDAAHQDALSLPVIEAALYPCGVEVVACADVFYRDGAGESDPVGEDLATGGFLGEYRIAKDVGDFDVAERFSAESGDITRVGVDEDVTLLEVQVPRLRCSPRSRVARNEGGCC